jgi:RNA recognition motif-containing protein
MGQFCEDGCRIDLPRRTVPTPALGLLALRSRRDIAIPGPSREERLPVRLFIGNLPYDATDAELRSHLGAVAPPSEVVLPLDRETGRPRGFAFVEFTERGTAEEVIRRFNAQPFKGRNLAISEARAREDRPAGPRPPSAFRPDMGPGPAAPSGGGERPRREFGPPAPPRRAKGPGRRPTKQEARPRGPIRERNTGRVFDVDDGEEEVEDLDSLATGSEDSVDGDDQE